MLMRQSRIITATIALALGGSMILAKPPANAEFPSITSQAQSLAQAPEGLPNRQNPPVRERKFKGGKLMEQLNLSESQKQQIDTIRQKYQGQTQQLHQEMRSERQKLQEMMAGTASEAEIRRQHQRVTQLDQQMHNFRFEGMLETRQVLTPEQRRQFAQLMQQHRGQSRERRGGQFRQRFRDPAQQGEF